MIPSNIPKEQYIPNIHTKEWKGFKSNPTNNPRYTPKSKSVFQIIRAFACFGSLFSFMYANTRFRTVSPKAESFWKDVANWVMNNGFLFTPKNKDFFSRINRENIAYFHGLNWDETIHSFLSPTRFFATIHIHGWDFLSSNSNVCRLFSSFYTDGAIEDGGSLTFRATYSKTCIERWSHFHFRPLAKWNFPFTKPSSSG